MKKNDKKTLEQVCAKSHEHAACISLKATLNYWP